MHKRSVLTLLTALIAGAIVLVGVVSAFGGPFSPLPPGTARHANLTDLSATCAGCHSYRSGDRHSRHLGGIFLAFGASTDYNMCKRCHAEGVNTGYEGDLSYANPTNTVVKAKRIGKQVYAAICKRCHAKFRSIGLAAHAGVTINSNCVSGTACHKKDGTGAGRSAGEGHSLADGGINVDWINRALDNTSVWQFCTLCHGQDGSYGGGGVVTNRVWYEVEETNPNTWP